LAALAARKLLKEELKRRVDIGHVLYPRQLLGNQFLQGSSRCNQMDCTVSARQQMLAFAHGQKWKVQAEEAASKAVKLISITKDIYSMN
jgi:hypothetical protein